MSDEYDPTEQKIIRRGISIQRVIAAYQHFGSLRKAASACGISKDTVAEVLRRNNIPQIKTSRMPKSNVYNPKNVYSNFAKWHKAHANDLNLPSSVSEIAKLAGVTADAVKCYFYRRRKQVSKILKLLPDIRALDIVLTDVHGNDFASGEFESYTFIIDRYSERAAIKAKLKNKAIEVTALIPSIETFVRRIKELSTSAPVPYSKPRKPSKDRQNREHPQPELDSGSEANPEASKDS